MRKYELARALATMETVPEIRARLLAAELRVETIIEEMGVLPREDSPLGRAYTVFQRLYGDAVVAIDATMETGGETAANELVALDSLTTRAEQAAEVFYRTTQSPGAMQASMGGGLGPLLVGAALLGVIWWLGKREPDFEF